MFFILKYRFGADSREICDRAKIRVELEIDDISLTTVVHSWATTNRPPPGQQRLPRRQPYTTKYVYYSNVIDLHRVSSKASHNLIEGRKSKGFCIY